MMFRSFLIVFIILYCSCSEHSLEVYQDSSAFSITTSPSETNCSKMNFSWATDTSINESVLEISTINDKMWKKSRKNVFRGVKCCTFDGLFSIGHSYEDIYENVVINKYNATISGLKPNTQYKYRIIAKGASVDHYFKTAGAKEWGVCIISDFHSYTPVYPRTESAMKMIDTISRFNNFDWILHLGDITAWGGSYSFWRNLYNESPFIKYMWAGVNGNHDSMSRDNIKSSNFFRDVSAFPENGYGNEMGVNYFFKYGDVLFIMLDSENLKDTTNISIAQDWMRSIVNNNPSRYRIVCEHYHWFDGKNGNSYQYDRWCSLFDELQIDLALSGHNHIYVSSYPIYGKIVTNANVGTIYIQTPSSDNERGVNIDYIEPLSSNKDKIKFRWTEGYNTVGALHMKVTPEKIKIVLIDRYGNNIDTNYIYPKKLKNHS